MLTRLPICLQFHSSAKVYMITRLVANVAVSACRNELIMFKAFKGPAVISRVIIIFFAVI